MNKFIAETLNSSTDGFTKSFKIFSFFLFYKSENLEKWQLLTCIIIFTDMIIIYDFDTLVKDYQNHSAMFLHDCILKTVKSNGAMAPLPT